MSDLLEPFRRAAELGCADFLLDCGAFSYAGNWELLPRIATPQELADGTDRPQRINRYAAAVCECWWRDRKESLDKECHRRLMRTNLVNTRSYECEIVESLRMIDLCREFARKHGGNA